MASQVGASQRSTNNNSRQNPRTVSGPARASNYIDEQQLCAQFLQQFQEGDSLKYMEALQNIADRQSNVLQVCLDDVLGWGSDEGFVERIQINARRYMELFAKAADILMPRPTPGRENTSQTTEGVDDVFDVLLSQRIQQQEESSRAASGSGNVPSDPHAAFPPSLLRRYEVNIVPPTKLKCVSLREVRADKIGSLVKITGIVTRASDVKPMVSVATYTCDKCGFEIYQEVASRSFMPLMQCPTEQCVSNRSKGRLHLQTRGSKFIKFQEIKIQEMPDQVPIGHIPRSMTVHAKQSCTRKCSPGDCITVSGIFLPTPFTGFKAIRAGLIANTYLEAQNIDRQKKSYEELGNTLTDEMEAEIDAAMDDPAIYNKLASSIAPEIYGHEDVKKALLLMLVGGATRKMKDGMKIRGDINICMMGDPGVGKSQLLKHIAGIAPRGVYTTGKGSSGVGLTAAVVRDSTTGEMALEGGALVLADMGICAIDEFDKMDEGDRTAIHEVMEQQTVSIAKGGVTTTLNARTAILAAANPLFGRYNRRYSPTENINLPAALLSRFDLLFLMLDKADRDFDVSLAKHVTHVHRFNRHPELDFEPLSPKFIRAYISQARKVEPFVPLELSQHIVQAYVDMRQDDLARAQERGAQSMLTARQLLSILRLAQALARLRFDERVSESDVGEAIRLLHASKRSLLDEEQDGFGGERMTDVMSSIYNLIRDLAMSKSVSSEVLEVQYTELEPMVLHKGFTQEQLQQCLEEYSTLNVWSVDAARTRVTFVDV